MDSRAPHEVRAELMEALRPAARRLARAERAKHRSGAHLARVWERIDRGELCPNEAEAAEERAMDLIRAAGRVLAKAEGDWRVAVMKQRGHAWASEVLDSERESLR